ncbi:MAG TPA: transglycosylase SLT domain-containing protein [Candidatus Binatia bacterium]
MTFSCFQSRRLLFLVVVGLAVVGARVADARDKAPRLEFGGEFQVPASLEDDVRFWVDVFTRYTLREAIVHDRSDPANVLAVVRLETGRREEVDAVRRRYEQLTSRLASASATELTQLLHMFRPPMDPKWIAASANRIRVQLGQREVFFNSILRSQRYLPTVRKVLAKAQLPEELAYLPHIESSFDHEARSHAGALGLWQLMPETAKQRDLRVDAQVDERKHTYKATMAAASYLREAFESLQSWPLAITSYNYGINGTRRAVEAIGSRDLEDILERHESPAFGFASRNFYAQFLAALHVARNEDYYFPEIAEMRRREYVVKKGDTLWQIARRHGVTVEKIRKANKSLSASARLQLGQRIQMPG